MVQQGGWRGWAEQTLPPLVWLRSYRLNALVWDLFAGITVALTLVPQSLGYASLAGLDKSYGLYSAYIGCFAYALFGTVKDIAVGPVAVVALLVSDALGGTPPDEIGTTLATLTFYVGAVELLMYLLRAGALLDLISHPVLVGFSNATALTIAVKQLSSFFGVSLADSGSLLTNLIQLFPALKDTNWWAVLMSSASLLVLLILRRVAPLFPRNAAVVAIATVVTWAFQLDVVWDLPIVGDLPAGLPSAVVPDFSKSLAILSSAILITLVSLMEHIAIGKALARKAHAPSVNTTQELLALGVANFTGAFASAMPVTGSFSRSTLAEQSGARTPLSSAVTGLVALFAVLFLTSAFKYIPDSTLGAVIIAAVLVMVAPAEAFHLMRLGPVDAAAVVVTFVGVVCLGAELGILIGILVSIFGALYAASRPTLELDAPVARLVRTDRKQMNGRDRYAIPAAAASSAGSTGSNSENENDTDNDNDNDHDNENDNENGRGGKGGSSAQAGAPLLERIVWVPESAMFGIATLSVVPAETGGTRAQRALRSLRTAVGLPAVPPAPPTPLPWGQVPLLPGGLLAVQVRESVWFPNAAFVADQLLAMVRAGRDGTGAAGTEPVRGVLLDLRYANRFDAVGLEALVALRETVEDDAGALLVLTGLDPVAEARVRGAAAGDAALEDASSGIIHVVDSAKRITERQVQAWEAARDAARTAAADARQAALATHKSWASRWRAWFASVASTKRVRAPSAVTPASNETTRLLGT